jgi:hypothetical protein
VPARDTIIIAHVHPHTERKVSIHRSGLGDDERLVVSPRRAAAMLDCGITRLYELISSGELQSFKDGAARKIVVASIRDYIARKIAQAA